MENKKLTYSNISIIAAMSPDHAIGYRGALPWHIPEDLRRFKNLTWGHAIIMGRNTFESLPHGALPGRRNIVLSRSMTEIEGCEVFGDLPTAIKKCSDDDEVFIIGGATVYAQALPLARKLYITLVDNNPKEADAFFPIIEKDDWQEIKKEKHDGFSFVELERKAH